MKRIGLYVLFAAVLVAIGVLVYRDPIVQSKLATIQAGNVQDGYAQAICAGDADYLAAHSGGLYAMPIEEWRQIVASVNWTCSGVRYLGVVNGPAGPEYFYAMDIGDYELWYGLTVQGGKVVDIE